ncbi:MAG TPA: LysR family transcriptional regulator [Magnetospirillaceae bacterium]|nr:LysR family transcriptional regulator [Magnetospirillaceae bacterium]
MNWRKLDLNLLLIFDALMLDRNVTRAGMRLGMTQPAISHALARLRRSLGDELFVRAPEGMRPTPRAELLAPPIHQALKDIRFAVSGAASFCPLTDERVFTIAVNNYSALVLAAPLTAATAAEAPGITLDLRPSGTLDIADQLDHGRIDIALGSLGAPGERFRDLRIFADHYVAVMRADHPAVAGSDPLSAETLATLPHLVISSNWEPTDFIDIQLGELGLERQIALRTPLLAAAATLPNSDMVTVLTERAAREFTRNSTLRMVGLPFATPCLMTAMLWQRRFDDVAAHRWLRTLICRVARTL